jgi:hypothetical protein
MVFVLGVAVPLVIDGVVGVESPSLGVLTPLIGSASLFFSAFLGAGFFFTAFLG